jgi:hypothetical protein
MWSQISTHLSKECDCGITVTFLHVNVFTRVNAAFIYVLILYFIVYWQYMNYDTRLPQISQSQHTAYYVI